MSTRRPRGSGASWRKLAAAGALAFAAAVTAGCPSDDEGDVTIGPPPSDGPSAVPREAGPNGEPPPIAGGGLPQCKHLEDTEYFGYCIYKYAGGFPTAAEVDRLCAMAGKMESECRHAWVAGRMNADSGHATEDLLKVCKTNNDCSFELLDFRPDSDVLVQNELCRKYAGKHAPDCVGHAMQRWWGTQPDEEEMARVANTPTPYANKVGFWLGVAVTKECGGLGISCMGLPDTADHCKSTSENLARNASRCPSLQKKPMAHNKNRPTGGRKPAKPPKAGQGGHQGGKPPRKPPGAKRGPAHGHAPNGKPGGGRNPRPPGG